MAYFLVSKKRIREQWLKLKEVSDVISYSYKTNPVIGVLINEMFNETYFSIHSENNVKRLIEKNVNANKIIFFLQGQFEDEIKKLLDYGIRSFVIDNISDLERLRNVIELDKLNMLFLRLKFKEHSIYTGKHFVYGFKWKDALELIAEMENVNVGIHFHRKTQNVGEWNLKHELEEIASYNEDAWQKIKFVNIGGGLPWYYHNSKPEMEEIMKKIKELKEWLNNSNKLLFIEPGRFIAAPAARLVAKVKNVYDNIAILDCSIFNAYMDTFLLNLRLQVLGEKEKDFAYLLKGCSPDSLDIFRYRVFFDKPLKVGDEIVFLDAGAYNFYTEFGNLDKLDYKIVEDF